MCLRVCVCVRLSRGYLRNHTRDLTKFLCMLPMAVTPSSSDTATKSQEEGAVLGVFFLVNNALYSTAFATHTETSEPIEMPFGMMSVLDPRNSVLRGVTIPEG